MSTNSIGFSGYVVRFCPDSSSHSSCVSHLASECPNKRNSIYYVDDRGGARKITDTINSKRVPLIVGHDKENNVIGYVKSAELIPGSGILVQGVIDDAFLLDAIQNQYSVYTKEYTDQITFEQYLMNIFSSISLSHNPRTWDVNHIGLVNIPARLGTAVSYYSEENVPRVTRSSSNNNTVNDLVTAHVVAFCRKPNRQQILNINNRYSYVDNAQYITASADYLNTDNKDVTLSSSIPPLPTETMASTAMDLVSQLFMQIGKDAMMNALNQQGGGQSGGGTRKRNATTAQLDVQPAAVVAPTAPAVASTSATTAVPPPNTTPTNVVPPVVEKEQQQQDPRVQQMDLKMNEITDKYDKMAQQIEALSKVIMEQNKVFTAVTAQQQVQAPPLAPAASTLPAAPKPAVQHQPVPVAVNASHGYGNSSNTSTSAASSSSSMENIVQRLWDSINVGDRVEV